MRSGPHACSCPANNINNRIRASVVAVQTAGTPHIHRIRLFALVASLTCAICRRVATRRYQGAWIGDSALCQPVEDNGRVAFRSIGTLIPAVSSIVSVQEIQSIVLFDLPFFCYAVGATLNNRQSNTKLTRLKTIERNLLRSAIGANLLCWIWLHLAWICWK